MKLAPKLLLSYLLVLLIGMAVLVIATAFVAPANFSQQMSHMRGRGAGMGEQRMAALDAEIDALFRDSINNALLASLLVAIPAATAVSWLMTQQISRPVRALVRLSQRIARGQYQQRLELNTRDELADLVESFNRMAEALNETERMRQRLLGDVTHELKTPLSSIKGYMEGLQDGVLPATPATFELIHQEADRLGRLVQDLQELSRVETGQMTFERTVQTPAALVLPVVERMRPQFQDQQIALDVSLSSTLSQVRADADRVAQVLTNLLGNALQYTPEGGHVHIEVERDGDRVAFRVTDSGIGLAADDVDRIFQRFYRVDKSRSRSSGGSGIGLTIARHLIEAQSGTLWAASAGPGQGSCFTFTLPLA